MTINEVMLAPRGWSPDMARFPYLGTPKIDGIRFYRDAGDVWTRANKTIPNLVIRNELPKFLPDGIDGELYINDFSQSMSTVMSELTVPEVGIYLFDHVDQTSEMYMNRVRRLKAFVESAGWEKIKSPNGLPHYRPNGKFTGRYHIVPLYPLWIKNHVQFEKFYQLALNNGHEGVILRSPESPYHFGRPSLTKNWMAKYKPTEDREARIIGFEELMINHNEAFTDERGNQKRSKAQDGLVPGGRLGSLLVRDVETEVAFSVGGGPNLTTTLRLQLWNDRHSLTGRVIKYRSLAYGAKDKPRQPQFLGFRDERDMS